MSVSVSASLVHASFNGGTAAGAISVPGLKAGDRVFSVLENGSAANLAQGTFEQVVSVDDEFQQIDAADLSSLALDVLLVRGR